MPINNLMEDAATAEISRAQIWQWIHHPKGILEDGRKVTVELFRQVLEEEKQKIRQRIGDAVYEAGRFEDAARLLDRLVTQEQFEEFLTLPGYEMID
ncbi:MAG: hypothetical protein A6D91_10630 [Bacillaceae bacterium G1]|nr:MAG: hypothetical protein A6D91_10630 [Bacillaceae bacterium G1]